MNIKRFTISTESANYHTPTSAADKTRPAANKASGDFDKATFHKPAEPADDSSFAQMLARETTARLKQTDNQEKVAKLQQQVASGDYQPDARRIAERILGYR